MPQPTATPELDVEFVRSFFPNLGDGWAFFENAGGSYVPRTVIEHVTAYMTEMQVQPGGVVCRCSCRLRCRNERYEVGAGQSDLAVHKPPHHE